MEGTTAQQIGYQVTTPKNQLEATALRSIS